MTENDGVYKFIEYLDALNEQITTFKSVVGATEIMDELPLTDEQIEASNVFLNELQTEWQKQFLEFLEFGIEWIKMQNNGEGL